MIQKIKKYSTTNTLVILGIVLGVAFGSLLPELALKQQVIGQMFISFLKRPTDILCMQLKLCFLVETCTPPKDDVLLFLHLYYTTTGLFSANLYEQVGIFHDFPMKMFNKI